MAVLNGTSGNDTLIGGSEADQLYGMGGSDHLEGRGGNDLLDAGPDGGFLSGGVGNDTLVGGDGTDFFGSEELDSLGDDFLFGGAGDDYFDDRFGDNVLDGGDGADLFSAWIADEGSNIVTGGNGSDIYRPISFNSGLEYVVTDFQVGLGGDLLDLDDILNTSASNVFFLGGNPFDPALGFLRFLQSGPDTLVQWDHDGAAGTGGNDWVTQLTLRNINAATITQHNIVSDIPVDGSAVPDRTITGTDGDDVDILQGWLGNDTLIGGDGNDYFNSGPSYLHSIGNDSLVGGNGNDIFLDTLGDNTFMGGAGADVFEIFSYDGGTNILTGGSGRDVYRPALAPYFLRTSLDYRVTDFVPGPGGDLIDLDGLLEVSATYGFYSHGNPFDPAIGIFRLLQSGSNTLVQVDVDGAAGSGYGGWGTVLTLQNFNFTATSLTADNIVNNIPPDGSTPPGQIIDGTLQADTLVGGPSNDTISGLDGNDNIAGKNGNDHLDGGNGNDVIGGGLGNDTLIGGNGNDHLGTADLEVAGDDLMLGGAGDDVFFDSSGENVLDGGDGADRFIIWDNGSLTAANKLTGGLGQDIYEIDNTDESTYVVTDFAAGVGGDLLDVDRILAASAHSSQGYVGGNPFDGNLGFLRLLQSGDDTLLQFDADGEAGFNYSWMTLVTFQNLDRTAITSDNFVGQLVVGTAGDDSLVGGIGNDTVQGLGGNDTLDGSVGKDTLEGGTGSDIYFVDSGKDVVVEASNSSGALLLPGGEAAGPGLAGVSGITDTVIAAVNYSIASANFVENLTLSGSASRGTGNALGNKLTGNAGNDILSGGGGNDTLNGGTGNDGMKGGAGNDTYLVNAAGDVVTERSGQGTDTVRASVTETLDAYIERLVLTGSSAINGTGNGLANMLTGNSAANILNGSGGNDTLNGGGGADRLIGGAGNDTLIWQAADARVDGGGGTGDTLKLGVNLNVSRLANKKLLNVERVDMTGSGDDTLTLNSSEVLDLSAQSNVLTVLGNAGDKVNLMGAFKMQSTAGNFETWKLGAAIVKIEIELDVI